MGGGCPSESLRVLRNKETHWLGEYRTRSLVLDAWERIEAEGTFKRAMTDFG